MRSVIRQGNHQRRCKVRIGSIHILDFVTGNFRTGRRIFNNLVILAVIDNLRLFVHVGKRHDNSRSFCILIVSHVHMQRNLVVRSRFVVKHGTALHANFARGVIDNELVRRFHKAVVERTECCIGRIRIRSLNLTHKCIRRRVFWDGEVAILGGRLLVFIRHVNSCIRSNSVLRAVVIMVRKRKANIIIHVAGTILKQGFIVKLFAIIHSNNDSERMVVIFHDSRFEELACRNTGSRRQVSQRHRKRILVIGSILVRNLDRSKHGGIRSIFDNVVFILDVVNMGRFIHVNEVDGNLNSLRNEAICNLHMDCPARFCFEIKSIVLRN